MTTTQARRAASNARRGTTYLEVQIAFAALGVALAGLGPMVVAQIRLMGRVEARFPASATYYLSPPAQPWAARLGASALRGTDPPVAAPAPAPGGVNAVTLVTPPPPALDDQASVVVAVDPIEPP
jgi:hypothetical protein